MTLSKLPPTELFSIGACLCLLLFASVFATWQTFRSKTKIWLWAIYSALIWTGLAIALYSDKITTTTSAEMPPEFSLGVWLMIAGIIFTVAHGLVILTRRVRGNRTLQVS